MSTGTEGHTAMKKEKRRDTRDPYTQRQGVRRRDGYRDTQRDRLVERDTQETPRHSEMGTHTGTDSYTNTGGYTEAEAHVQERERRDRIRDRHTPDLERESHRDTRRYLAWDTQTHTCLPGLPQSSLCVSWRLWRSPGLPGWLES